MVPPLEVSQNHSNNFNIIKLIFHCVNVICLDFRETLLFESSEGRINICDNIRSNLEHFKSG